MAAASKITEVFNVPQANRPANTYTFDVAQPVPSELRYAHLEIILDLNADKLVIGKSMDVAFYFSPDAKAYSFANSIHWESYGPDGYIRSNPDGTTDANPNPRIQIPLLERAGQFIRGTAVLNNSFFAGASIRIIT